MIGRTPSLRASLSLLFFAACVPVPPGMLPQGTETGQASAAAAAYPDVEPGGTSYTSLHFTLRGYDDNELKKIAQSAEDSLNKIGITTGLSSYLAGQTYSIIVYKEASEYATKTKQPNGSRIVVAGKTIYTYPGPDLDPYLAHHLMHTIFASYMGDKLASLRWLDEGLAMNQEVYRMSDLERIAFQTAQSNKLRTNRMPFSQMTFAAGSDELQRREDAWHLQTESVVAFLLKQGSSLVFSAFLNELRNGADLDKSISDNYSGKFRGLADFETTWIAAT